MNNFKQDAIKKVEGEMKEKAVNKEDGEKLLPNWKNKLTLLRSMKELEENRDFFLKKIRDFSEATNKEEQERVYEETRIQTEELEKEQAENRNKEQQEQEKLNDKGREDDNQPNNNKPSPDKEPKTSNNPLPSPSEVQNNYNSDQDKSTIDNNPTLTDSQEKQKANEFLKMVISAELLTKKKQFNSEILTKLITEKKNNTSLYQLLNKEGRVDKVISQLEGIKQSQSQKDKDKLVDNKKNQKDSKLLTGIIAVIGIFLAILGLGMIVIVRKRMKRKFK